MISYGSKKLFRHPIFHTKKLKNPENYYITSGYTENPQITREVFRPKSNLPAGYRGGYTSASTSVVRFPQTQSRLPTCPVTVLPQSACVHTCVVSLQQAASKQLLLPLTGTTVQSVPESRVPYTSQGPGSRSGDLSCTGCARAGGGVP